MGWNPSNSNEIRPFRIRRFKVRISTSKVQTNQTQITRMACRCRCDCDHMHGGSMLLEVHGFWKAQNQKTKRKNDHWTIIIESTFFLEFAWCSKHGKSTHLVLSVSAIPLLKILYSLPAYLLWFLVAQRKRDIVETLFERFLLKMDTSAFWCILQLRRVRPCLISSSSPWLQAWSEQTSSDFSDFSRSRIQSSGKRMFSCSPILLHGPCIGQKHEKHASLNISHCTL